MKKKMSLVRHLKTLGLVGAVAMGSSSTLYAADWSDTFVGYRYGSQFAEPAIAGDIAKNIFQLTHVSGYKYGVNFFNVDFLKFD